MKNILILISIFLLQACGTMAYTPTEYTLRKGLIPEMTVNGSASVINAQPSKDEVIVYSYGGSKLASSLNDITALMVKQTDGEISKNFKVSGGATKKTIELKVDSLLSQYVFYSWKSEINFTAKLGDGTVVNKVVNHKSGSLHQDLNGCIAEGVMTLLNDAKVRAYLAK
jgi:hypothetical protein